MTDEIYNCKAHNVLKIISDYLRTNGYDGLYNAEESCGCKLGDLAPCDMSPLKCEPGYLCGEWFIEEKKQ